MNLPPLGTTFPVWVSRPTAGKQISQLTLNLYLTLVIYFAIVANVLLWSGIGLVTAIERIF